MADAGFTPVELIHLLASHTIARSDTLVPGHEAVPFDTTPFTFDTQIFLEVLLKGVGVPFGVNNTDGAEVDSPIPQSNEMRLQSDFALARDVRTACEWQSFTNDQEKFQETFPDVFGRLQLLGVDQSTLIDCSEVIPQPPPLPANSRPQFPAGKSRADVEQAVSG